MRRSGKARPARQHLEAGEPRFREPEHADILSSLPSEGLGRPTVRAISAHAAEDPGAGRSERSWR